MFVPPSESPMVSLRDVATQEIELPQRVADTPRFADSERDDLNAPGRDVNDQSNIFDDEKPSASGGNETDILDDDRSDIYDDKSRSLEDDEPDVCDTVSGDESQVSDSRDDKLDLCYSKQWTFEDESDEDVSDWYV